MTSSKRPRIAILGAGAMGEALAAGLLRAGWATKELRLAARREIRAATVRENTGIETTLDAASAAEFGEVVVLAVKPKDVPALLDQIADALSSTQLVLSLAAGVTTAYIESRVGQIPIVRAMPNTPALVDEGITGYAAGSFAGEDELAIAATVLGAVGNVIAMDEQLLDAVTAVSGTGPAYVFLLAEALIESALREGLPRDLAEVMVHQTVRGAGTMLIETGLGASELRAQVTSPGGTTAAAVHVLEERGFRALVEDAVAAAARRSREMGRSAARGPGAEPDA